MDTLKIIVVSTVVSIFCCAIFSQCKPWFQEKINKAKSYIHQKTAS